MDLAKFYTAYWSLAVFSFSVQHALEEQTSDLSYCKRVPYEKLSGSANRRPEQSVSRPVDAPNKFLKSQRRLCPSTLLCKSHPTAIGNLSCTPRFVALLSVFGCSLD